LPDDARSRLLNTIRSNIASAGYHITLVQGGRSPRFAYSVGLTDVGDPEVVLAGAASLGAKAVKRVLDQAVERSNIGTLSPGEIVDVPDIGSFQVARADPSWTQRMLLGAFDYYDRRDVTALQLIPDPSLRTIDVPDMSQQWDASREPVWRWLGEDWDLSIPPDAIAVTNLDALRGNPVCEAARWEEAEWELFAGSGPDTPRSEVRVVPLSTLLGFDPSLQAVADLDVGSAIHRDPPGPWEPWG
jgi:hypothetical protein